MFNSHLFLLASVGAFRVSIVGAGILLILILLAALGIRQGRSGALDFARLLMWVEFLYLVRFQLIAALLLTVILPACYFLVPSIFIGLFDARGVWSFVLVVWMAGQLAWT